MTAPKCPYPPNIIDESSGVIVSNDLCRVWNKGSKATIQAVVEWADSWCPHGTLCVDTSKALRRECESCWQAFEREFLPGREGE